MKFDHLHIWLLAFFSMSCQTIQTWTQSEEGIKKPEMQRVVGVSYWVDQQWVNRGFCVDSHSVGETCQQFKSRIPLGIFKKAWNQQASIKARIYTELLKKRNSNTFATSGDASSKSRSEETTVDLAVVISALERSDEFLIKWIEGADLPRYESLPQQEPIDSDSLLESMVHDAYGMSQFRFWDETGKLWRFGGNLIPFLGASEVCHGLFGEFSLPTAKEADSIMQIGLSSTTLFPVLRIHYPMFSGNRSFWVKDLPVFSDDHENLYAIEGRAWARSADHSEIAGQLIELDGFAALLCRSEVEDKQGQLATP